MVLLDPLNKVPMKPRSKIWLPMPLPGPGPFQGRFVVHIQRRTLEDQAEERALVSDRDHSLVWTGRDRKYQDWDMHRGHDIYSWKYIRVEALVSSVHLYNTPENVSNMRGAPCHEQSLVTCSEDGSVSAALPVLAAADRHLTKRPWINWWLIPPRWSSPLTGYTTARLLLWNIAGIATDLDHEFLL